MAQKEKYFSCFYISHCYKKNKFSILLNHHMFPVIAHQLDWISMYYSTAISKKRDKFVLDDIKNHLQSMCNQQNTYFQTKFNTDVKTKLTDSSPELITHLTHIIKFMHIWIHVIYISNAHADSIQTIIFQKFSNHQHTFYVWALIWLIPLLTMQNKLYQNESNIFHTSFLVQLWPILVTGILKIIIYS